MDLASEQIRLRCLEEVSHYPLYVDTQASRLDLCMTFRECLSKGLRLDEISAADILFVIPFCETSHTRRSLLESSPAPSSVSLPAVLFPPLAVYMVLACVLVWKFKTWPSFIAAISNTLQSTFEKNSLHRTFKIARFDISQQEVSAVLALLTACTTFVSFVIYLVNINQTQIYTSIQAYSLILEALSFLLPALLIHVGRCQQIFQYFRPTPTEWFILLLTKIEGAQLLQLHLEKQRTRCVIFRQDQTRPERQLIQTCNTLLSLFLCPLQAVAFSAMAADFANRVLVDQSISVGEFFWNMRSFVAQYALNHPSWISVDHAVNAFLSIAVAAVVSVVYALSGVGMVLVCVSNMRRGDADATLQKPMIFDEGSDEEKQRVGSYSNGTYGTTTQNHK
ncbi:hypothetical protein BJ741DRAFT_621494 [Chytriomyces cf. hyalinus JEL632]|nr:hypothetical protein BJ741DRAFT_621494 [Chytriomyces cf. hyalinus JEL632]